MENYIIIKKKNELQLLHHSHMGYYHSIMLSKGSWAQKSVPTNSARFHLHDVQEQGKLSLKL